MRVRIVGHSLSANAVRSSLYSAHIAMSDIDYDYTIEFIAAPGGVPTIDGVDSEFERQMINRICDCADSSVLLLRPGGIRSDQHVRIGIPNASALMVGIEKGVVQAVLRFMTPPPEKRVAVPAPPVVQHWIEPPVVASWWERFKLWLASFPL